MEVCSGRTRRRGECFIGSQSVTYKIFYLCLVSPTKYVCDICPEYMTITEVTPIVFSALTFGLSLGSLSVLFSNTNPLLYSYYLGLEVKSMQILRYLRLLTYWWGLLLDCLKHVSLFWQQHGLLFLYWIFCHGIPVLQWLFSCHWVSDMLSKSVSSFRDRHSTSPILFLAF